MKTLIIFAKAPVKGEVKTRLTKNTPLNEKDVLGLYEGFLKDTIIIATLTEAERIALYFTPVEEEKAIKKLVKRLKIGVRNENRFTYTSQEGENFTERVANAFEKEAISGATEMIMIGADAPLLKPAVIDTAFDFVYARSGMALGPSAEGGLYLIGYPSDMNINYDGVFTEGSEIENLLALAKQIETPVRLLPEALDVDVEADLITLLGLIRALDYERKFVSSLFPTHTFKAIEELGLGVTRASDDTRSKKLVKQ